MFFSFRRLLTLLVLVSLAAVAFSHPGRVAVKSLLLMPDLFPASPVRPLTWLTPEPRVESIQFDYAGGSARADVYHPGTTGRHGAMIIALGAWRVPRADPTLVRFATGLARAGAVVMIPESEHLEAGRIRLDERDALVVAFQRLQQFEDVDPERVGYQGFSIGGGLVTLASLDPRIRDQVAFVNTTGGYFDARLLLEQVATRSILVDGERRPWQPADVTLTVFGIQLAEFLDAPADRDVLFELAQQSALPPDAASRLTPQGRALLRLLQGVEPHEYGEALAALPEPAVAYLDGLSPAPQMDELRARLYVMHDVGDHYIPFTQSRYLADTLAPPALRLYTEFSIFEHVIPDRPVDVATFSVDAAKLYRHLVMLGLEFL